LDVGVETNIQKANEKISILTGVLKDKSKEAKIMKKV